MHLEAPKCQRMVCTSATIYICNQQQTSIDIAMQHALKHLFTMRANINKLLKKHLHIVLFMKCTAVVHIDCNAQQLTAMME